MSNEARDTLYRADRYSLEKVRSTYIPHPDGAFDVDRNTFLLGYPGIGKSTVLRTRLDELSGNENLVTTYVNAERAIARHSAELAVPLDSERSSPRELDILRCAEVTLAVAVVSAIDAPDAARQGRDILIQMAHDLPRWADRYGMPRPDPTLSPMEFRTNVSMIVDAIVDLQVDPPTSVLGFSFQTFCSSLAERIEGSRSLLVAIDQIDNLPRVVIDLLGSTVRSHNPYTTILAARPFPYPPHDGELAEIPSADAIPHWIGESIESPNWDEFLRELVTRRSSAARASLALRYPTALFGYLGHSPRQLLRYVAALPESNDPTSGIWGRMLASTAVQASRDIMTAMGTRVQYPLRFITAICNAALQGRLGEGPGPTRVKIVDRTGGRWSPIARDVFRLAVREGLLIPTEPSAAMGYGEVGGSEYHLNPLVLVREETATNRLEYFSRDSSQTIELDIDQIRAWAEKCEARPRAKASKSKTVFVSHWFAENRLYENLQTRLSGHAIVRSGYTTDGEVARDVQERVKDSDRFLVDLTAYRPQCFVELGWAIGFGKPVIWTAEERSILESLPAWIASNFELYPYGSRDGMDLLVSHIHSSLNRPQDALQRWTATPQRSLVVNPDERQVTLMGGSKSEASLTVLRDQCRALGFDSPTHIDFSSEDFAQPLYDAIYWGRRSSLLVLHLAHDYDVDLLLYVAAGVLSVKPVFGRKKWKRRIVVVHDGDAEGLPSFLSHNGEICNRFGSLRLGAKVVKESLESLRR